MSHLGPENRQIKLSHLQTTLELVLAVQMVAVVGIGEDQMEKRKEFAPHGIRGRKVTDLTEHDVQ